MRLLERHRIDVEIAAKHLSCFGPGSTGCVATVAQLVCNSRSGRPKSSVLCLLFDSPLTEECLSRLVVEIDTIAHHCGLKRPRAPSGDGAFVDALEFGQSDLCNVSHLDATRLQAVAQPFKKKSIFRARRAATT